MRRQGRLGIILRPSDRVGGTAALPQLRKKPQAAGTAAKCHVWTAPSWQGESSRRRGWSVQPCVRPVSAVRMTAGHNALRGSGPRHVWTAPSWQGESSRRRGWSVQPCVRPVSAVRMTAGHNALRGSGPGQKLAFDHALALVGCPDRRIDRLCITCCSPSQPSHHAGWPARYRSPRKRDGFLVALTLCHHGPGHSRDLVGKRDRGHLRRPPRQQCREPRPMLSAVEFGIADHCQRAVNRLRRYRSPRLLMLPSFSLPPLEFCFGTSPIQAEKSRPDRKALASPTLATRAVANAGPTPGISSSRLLVSLDRCQAMIRRSNCRIWAFSIRNWAPRAARHPRAISGTRLSLESATTSSSASTPLRPTGATMPNSARWARIALITAVCCRMNRWRVRWSIRQLCCSGVLVSTNRMFALVTASQIASASAASFFCRFTYGFT